MKWALKCITKSSDRMDQSFALSDPIALQELPEFRKLQQPGFVPLKDNWDMLVHSRTEHSLITEKPIWRSENDSRVVDCVRAIQSQGINDFINTRSCFFESLSICGIVRQIDLNIIANDFSNPKC